MRFPLTLEHLWDVLIALLGAIASFFGYLNRRKLNVLHVMINSRLTALLKATRTGAFAEGQQDEKQRSASSVERRASRQKKK